MLSKKQTAAFQKWLEGLADNIQIKVNDYVDRVLAGNTSNCKALRKGISEIVIDYQKGYRVYYTVLEDNTILLLLFGGSKGGNQKEQDRDIERAIAMRDYLKEREEI
jgi:putative addiction module killer protein